MTYMYSELWITKNISLYSTIKSKILKMASSELGDCLEGIMGRAFWVMHF